MIIEGCTDLEEEILDETSTTGLSAKQAADGARLYNRAAESGRAITPADAEKSGVRSALFRADAGAM